jgi:hypothetical protein
MKGALLELSAKGDPDVILVGNPQMTYFKSVHKRHTNFARFEHKQIFTGDYGFGKRVVANIDKKGDLLYRMLLNVKLPAIVPISPDSPATWINSIGNFLVKKVTLKIGGEPIVEMTGDYMDIYHQFVLESDQYANYSAMVGRVPLLNTNSQPGPLNLFIPLPFWFTKELSQVLPIISIGYMDITVEVDFRDLVDCIYTGDNKTNLANYVANLSSLEFTDCQIISEYIYLDPAERIAFAKKPEFDYLIEQVQTVDYSISDTQLTGNFDIYFNLPVKQLMWFYRSEDNENINRWDLYIVGDSVNPIAPILTSNLLLNGLDRFEKRDGDYFRLVQPLYHNRSCSVNSYVYEYCFGEKVDELQPSGSCDFSLIDDIRLLMEFASGVTVGRIVIIGVNYNYIKIKSGMAGLAFTA